MSQLLINGDKKAAASTGHCVVRCLGPFQISGPQCCHPQIWYATVKSLICCSSLWVAVNHHSAHFPLQDLKPGNLAVNQDCELKVCTVKDYGWMSSRDLSNNHTTHRVSYSGVIPSASVEDLGLWLGPQRRCWDDGLRGDPLVPGSWGHSELDALHPDWQENCSCSIFQQLFSHSSQWCVGLSVPSGLLPLWSCSQAFFFLFSCGLDGALWVSSLFLYTCFWCARRRQECGRSSTNPDFLEAFSIRHSLTAAW